jgi:hypothetical protein
VASLAVVASGDRVTRSVAPGLVAAGVSVAERAGRVLMLSDTAATLNDW